MLQKGFHYPSHKNTVTPPLGNPWHRSMLRRQTQVHNGSVRNKLCNRVLAAGDVGLHLLQSSLRRCVLRRGEYPHAVPPSPMLSLCHPASHHVVESSQQYPNAGSHMLVYICMLVYIFSTEDGVILSLYYCKD